MAGAANIAAVCNILKFTTFGFAADLAETAARISLRSVQSAMARSTKWDNEKSAVNDQISSKCLRVSVKIF
jgi:hypothetical protein